MALNGTISVGLDFRRTYTTTTGGNNLSGSASEKVGRSTQSTTIADGTGSGQANEAWGQRVTIGATSSINIDLQALPSIQGNKSLQKLKVLLISNLSTVAADKVIVGDAASNPWSAPFDAATDTVDVFGSADVLLTNPLTG